MREVVAQIEKPVLLCSGSKESIVMVHLARKAFAVTVASAGGFLMPIGYQMVMGPGENRNGAHARAGLPVSILVFATTVIACTLAWL